MENNQINKLEYINKLKSEVNRLNEENIKLKQYVIDLEEEAENLRNDNVIESELNTELIIKLYDLLKKICDEIRKEFGYYFNASIKN